MSIPIKRVHLIVEGQTELLFCRDVLAPYMGERGIILTTSLISKPGSNGGDVKFSRARRDILNHLREKSAPIVSTMVDYYGIKEWPDLEKARKCSVPQQIADILNKAVRKKICEDDVARGCRFVPYISMHEFEALLFSRPDVLAIHLGVKQSEVDDLVSNSGGTESINSGRDTAPSKRILKWCPSYKKTIDGIAIAKEIGIPTIRKACPLFDAWLNELESSPVSP